MKEKLFACIMLSLITLLVSVNTFFVCAEADVFLNRVEKLDFSGETYSATKKEVEKLYNDFKATETFISLTVNHDDLTNIEDCFAELIGHVNSENTEEAMVIKSRLINSLCHLRRLSGINIDAII